MSKTLFISDLDGTLLDSGAKLSEFTVRTVNELISRGMYFTFATARTLYTAAPLTAGLNVNVPCILNNGAGIYDMQTGKYVRKAFIPKDVAARLIGAFRDGGVGCMMFRFADEVLYLCIDGHINTPGMLAYIADRKAKTAKRFIECIDVADENDGSAVYINANGPYEKMLPICNAVREIKGADCAFYKDNYTDNWYLETFSDTASKANGIRFLREEYGFDRVVAFGDNLNDLSMFGEADVCVAVGNGADEVLEKADLIADTNDNNGVAEMLRELYEQYQYQNNNYKGEK